MSVVPEALAQQRFREPFEHTVYLPDGTLSEETTGPTTSDWTELDRISPFMQIAVLTTEDGAFYKHRGFNRAAMRNALVADLEGRTVRSRSQHHHDAALEEPLPVPRQRRSRGSSRRSFWRTMSSRPSRRRS